MRDRDTHALQDLFLDATSTGFITDTMTTLYFKPEWVQKICSGEKTEEARVLQWHWRGDIADGADPMPTVVNCKPSGSIGVGDWVIAREPETLVTVFAVTNRREWGTIGEAYESCGEQLIPRALSDVTCAQEANAFYQRMFDSKRRALINPNNGIPNATVVTFTIEHLFEFYLCHDY